METVRKNDKENKKKGSEVSEQIRARLARLKYTGKSITQFARENGWNEDTFYAAIKGLRNSRLSKKMTALVDTLPLPGSQANREN